MKKLSFGTPLEQLSLETYWERTEHLWKAAAELLNVGVVASNSQEKTVASLQNALTAYGVRWFSADEIASIHYGKLARDVAHEFVTECNGPRFILPVYCWLMYGVIFTLADKLREAANEPAAVRNTWRPRPYNLRVSDAQYSDHIWIPAPDLDFRTWLGRRRASKALKPYQASGLLRMSVGTGRKTIHMGVFAPKTLVDGTKRRDWKYGKPDAK